MLVSWVIPRELASCRVKEASSLKLFATPEAIILPQGKKSCEIRFLVWKLNCKVNLFLLRK